MDVVQRICHGTEIGRISAYAKSLPNIHGGVANAVDRFCTRRCNILVISVFDSAGMKIIIATLYFLFLLILFFMLQRIS